MLNLICAINLCIIFQLMKMDSINNNNSSQDSEEKNGNTTPLSESQDDEVQASSSEECFQKCIFMLEKASSDTEKFAALLMVTKLVKANELDETCSRHLLNAIGLNFLGRMLATTDVPEGCPPFMFKSIALTVLNCFVSTCHGDPALHRLLPLLAGIISDSEFLENDLVLVKEAYQCLSSISSDTVGRKALIDFEIIGSLVEAYTNENLYHENSLTILRNIAVDKECKMWEDEPEAFSKLMDCMCKEFADNQSEKKFLLCDALIDIIPSMVDEYSRLSNEGSWQKPLHKGLSDILFSKLNPELRNKGLQLASVVLEILGVLYVVSGGEKGRQLLLLMVHLACIEVRMSLEDKTIQESVSLAIQTTACYSIIEEAIKFLVNGAMVLEEKQKQQLYAALKGAFNGVLEFLNEASTNEDIYSGKSKKTQMFVCASVRVLGAWLAEETSANKEEVYKILPFLIKIAKYNFTNNSYTHNKKKGIIKEKKEKLPDLLRFLLPGLCHLTAEDTPRQILIDLDVEMLLFDYLVFQWICAVNYINEDTPGKLDLSPNSDTMITICNIFMNLVVQEAKRIKNSLLYYHLLKLIFSKVPEIPTENKHLQLIGSFCTLGLMIFRHQFSNVSNIQKMEISVYRFIQATVRFLWDGYNVEESNDYATLVVSSAYREHWNDLVEFWYLSMHTLTLLLPNVPWICNFLIDSEWPQTIVETFILLKDGGIEASVKNSYEDLLYTLIMASKGAKEVLLIKGLKNICKTHKLEKITQIL
ncbi:UNVERIFIED_CONTAM: hypothetical protein RMT77_013402 [Armadillidium vulgare]